MDARVRHKDMKVNTTLVLTTAFLASSISSALLSQGSQTHLGKTPLLRVFRTHITGASSCWRPSPRPHGQCPSMAVQAVCSHQIQLCPGRHRSSPPASGPGLKPSHRLPGKPEQVRWGRERGRTRKRDGTSTCSPGTLRSNAAELLSNPSPSPPALEQCTAGLELHPNRL